MASISEELARFAIAEYNKKANANLVFDKVIYNVTIVASEGGQKKVYEAKVSVNELKNIKELQEFKLVGNETSKAAGGISSNSNLVFDKVIYDITVVAADGGQKKVYEAKVAANESQNIKELKEFKLVGNEASKPAAGGISSVSL
nr:cysteine proteinase inhibitor A-like [Ipomoea batatas]